MDYQAYTIVDAAGGGIILLHNGSEVEACDTVDEAAQAAARDAIAAGAEAVSDFVVDVAAQSGMTLEEALGDAAFRGTLAGAFVQNWSDAARPSPR